MSPASASAFALPTAPVVRCRRRHRLCPTSSAAQNNLPSTSSSSSSPPPPSEPTTRFRARVAYDGTNYCGWQLQPRVPTVQGALERVFSRRFGRPIRVVGASRTDSGVHARGQAVHLDLPTRTAPYTQEAEEHLQFVVNRMLPEDVRVSKLGVAPRLEKATSSSSSSSSPSLQRPWNVLYAATGKLYAYRLCVGAVMDPQLRLYVYREWRAERGRFCPHRLSAAVKLFEGRHDFTAFANASNLPDGVVAATLVNPVRTVRRASVRDEGGGVWTVEFEIDGAFYRMIRNIMGTVLDVACFKLELDDVRRLFQGRDRRAVPKAAPAHGLCLEEVFIGGWAL